MTEIIAMIIIGLIGVFALLVYLIMVIFLLKLLLKIWGPKDPPKKGPKHRAEEDYEEEVHV